MILAVTVAAGSTAKSCTGECEKAGPIGLAVILVLCVACYFLFKSMSRHLRTVREQAAADERARAEAADERRRASAANGVQKAPSPPASSTASPMGSAAQPLPAAEPMNLRKDDAGAGAPDPAARPDQSP